MLDMMKEAMKRRMDGGLVVKIGIEPPGAKGMEAQREEDKKSDLAPNPMEEKKMAELEIEPMNPPYDKDSDQDPEDLPEAPMGLGKRDMEMPPHTRTLNMKVQAEMAKKKKEMKA